MNMAMDFERRFGGVARLYGESALDRFAAAHVCVVGVGGVGSWVVEALARSGIGQLTLIDLDQVAESNINRQIQALESTLGMAKIGALRARIGEINPACQVDLIEDFVAADNMDALLPRCDWLIDCIDGFRVKAALIAHCKRRKQPLVTVGGAGGKRDPGQIQQTDLSRTEQDPLLAKTRRLLRTDYGFSSNPKRSFGVPCIYSREAHHPGAVCFSSGLNCGGFGSSVAVTASMGLYASARVLEGLAKGLDR